MLCIIERANSKSPNFGHSRKCGADKEYSVVIGWGGRTQTPSVRLRLWLNCSAGLRACEEEFALARVAGERCGACELCLGISEAAELKKKVAANTGQ
jgi:hypothetical protein